MKYQPIIGLEIHIELKTKSKMFCSCENSPEEKKPNTSICPICTAQPGTLPVINEAAVEKVIKTGLALNCQIPEYSKFNRKSYFYPDLPKGYQISQYDMPLCKDGGLEICVSSVQSSICKRVRIRRIHLEEDTGKLVHPGGVDYSLVDFNRAGIPLMELVTEPDITLAKEARKFAQELQLILRYLNVSDANMERGEMRVEANISLSEDPLKDLGVKVEIKNLNSFRSVERAIEYEIKRQEEILNDGKKVLQETRGWDEKKEETLSQREKEEAHDYRYFPEPDLPLLHLGVEEYLNKIKAKIPELPQGRRGRFKQEYNLLEGEIEIFVQNKELGEYYEKVMSELRNWIKEVEVKDRVKEDEFFKLAKLSSNYIISDLQGLLKRPFVEDENFLITPENFAEFASLIYEGKISSKIAKNLLQEMLSKGGDPSLIVQEKRWALMTDDSEIEKIVGEVLAENEKAVLDYKNGKENSFQFLVGQVMSRTKGKASPETVNKVIKKLL